MPRTTKPRIILVADHQQVDHSSLSDVETLHEAPPTKGIEETKQAIRSLGYDSFLYTNPEDFFTHIAHHQNDVVLPFWIGSPGPNRPFFIPTLCDMYSIAYFGPDAASSGLAHDKLIANATFQDFSFNVPAFTHIYDELDLQKIDYIPPPRIIRPRFASSSIGISRTSITETTDETVNTIYFLWSSGFDHLLVQTFIYGSEVPIVTMGQPWRIDFSAAQESYIADAPYLLYNYPNSPDLKFSGQIKRRHLENETEQNLTFKAQRFFQKLSKSNIIRIDGRLTREGIYYFIELEVMPSIFPGNFPERLFRQQGRTYADLLAYFIRLAAEDWETRETSV